MELTGPSIGARHGIGRVRVMDLGLGAAHAAEVVSERIKMPKRGGELG